MEYFRFYLVIPVSIFDVHINVSFSKTCCCPKKTSSAFQRFFRRLTKLYLDLKSGTQFVKKIHEIKTLQTCVSYFWNFPNKIYRVSELQDLLCKKLSI